MGYFDVVGDGFERVDGLWVNLGFGWSVSRKSVSIEWRRERILVLRLKSSIGFCDWKFIMILEWRIDDSDDESLVLLSSSDLSIIWFNDVGWDEGSGILLLLGYCSIIGELLADISLTEIGE